MTAIMSTLLSPALSNIKADYPDESQTTVKLILTIPSLTLAISSPLTGIALSFGLSYKLVLLVSATLYAILGVVPYFVDSIAGIITLRAFFGIFAGSAEATSTVLLTVLEPQMDSHIRTRSVLYGIRAGVMSCTGFICSLVGGALADVGWRYIFLIHLVGLIYIVGYIFLPNVNIKKDKKKGNNVNEGSMVGDELDHVRNDGSKEEGLIESQGDMENKELELSSERREEKGYSKSDEKILGDEEKNMENNSEITDQKHEKKARIGAIIGVFITAFYTQLFFYAMPTNVSFYVSDSLGIDDAFLSGLMSGGSVLASGLASLLYPLLWKLIMKKKRDANCMNPSMSIVVSPHLIILVIATAPMAIGFGGLYLSQLYWPAWISGTILVGMFNGLNMPNCNMWGSRVSDKKWMSSVIGTVTSLTFLAHFVTPFVLDYLPGEGGDHTRIGFLLCSIMMLICSVLALIGVFVLECRKNKGSKE